MREKTCCTVSLKGYTVLLRRCHSSTLCAAHKSTLLSLYSSFVGGMMQKVVYLSQLKESSRAKGLQSLKA